MATNNAENFNFKLTNLSDNKNSPKNKKKPKRNLRPPTLKFIYDTIDSKDLDPIVKEELKKSAASFPHHALQLWIDQYDQFLTKARKDARNRMIAESNEKKNQVNKIDIENQNNDDISSDEPSGDEFISTDDYDPTA